MQIISPSYKVITNTDFDKLEKFIEQCGRVCYKSEALITEFSYKSFLKRIIKSGHLSVMEMGQVYFKINSKVAWVWPSNFIRQTLLSNLHKSFEYILSGSLRSFIESCRYVFLQYNPSDIEYQIGVAIISTLKSKYSCMDYVDIHYTQVIPECDVIFLNYRDVLELPLEIFNKHWCETVHFIIDRAMSHELVRHRLCSFLQESQRYCRYDHGITVIEPDLIDSAMVDIWYASMLQSEASYIKLIDAGVSPQSARSVLPNAIKTELIMQTTLEDWCHIFQLRTSLTAYPPIRRLLNQLKNDILNQPRKPQIVEVNYLC